MAGLCSRVKEEKQKGLRDLGINWVKSGTPPLLIPSREILGEIS